MQTMRILWQRLVDERGQTCDRCRATETAVEEAAQILKRSLSPLGIDVVLEKRTLSPTLFLKDPLQSNRIWIAEEPIEKWLSASSGQSKCCSTCGDSDCRTVMVDDKTFEAIPVELIVKAGILASARLVHGKAYGTCCPPVDLPKRSDGCCPASSEWQK